MTKVIIINCGYGNGPYLRATEIALAVTKLLNEEWKIVVPHVYGDRQARIMKEEFGDHPSITLDPTLGALLKTLFFDGTSYSAFLTHWLTHVDEVSTSMCNYIKSTYGNIYTEISRAPLAMLGAQHSYYNSFSRTSQILQRSIGNDAIAIEDTLLTQAAKKMKHLEDGYDEHFISIPGTFAPESNDIPIPPSANTKTWSDDLELGVYVTVSGIPNVDSLTQITDALGVPVYTNDASKIPNGIELPPEILMSKKIVAHIARAGWGAAWSSLLSETPLITLPYTSTDDPEIYFNNIRIQEIGVGTVWNNQTLEDIYDMQSSVSSYKTMLNEQFEGKNGATIAAEKIATLAV